MRKTPFEKGDLFTYGEEIDNGFRPFENAKENSSILIIPILVLIIICVFRPGLYRPAY